jgi:putative peptidoglycan lipid II flippase
MTALTLSCLMVGAIAFISQTVVNRGFYATQNTLLPAVFGTIAVVLSLPMYWIGLTLFGVAGVGLAISASAILQTLLLFSVWNRRSNNTAAMGVYRAYFNAAIGALVIGAILWSVHSSLQMSSHDQPMITNLVVIIIVSVVFVGLTGLWGWIFKIEAIRYIFGRVPCLTFLKKS